MTVFIGEPAMVLPTYFRCRIRMPKGAYEFAWQGTIKH